MTEEMDARWQRRLQPALTKYLSAFRQYPIRASMHRARAQALSAQSAHKDGLWGERASVWDGYLNDCTGWASEAISFVTNLERVRSSFGIVPRAAAHGFG